MLLDWLKDLPTGSVGTFVACVIENCSKLFLREMVAD